jgi:ribonuclease PH
VGIVSRFPVLDLCYGEDAAAGVDFNVVMTESGRFVEIQGTAENETFGTDELDTFLELGAKGIRELIALQKRALGIEARGSQAGVQEAPAADPAAASAG